MCWKTPSSGSRPSCSVSGPHTHSSTSRASWWEDPISCRKCTKMVHFRSCYPKNHCFDSDSCIWFTKVEISAWGLRPLDQIVLIRKNNLQLLWATDRALRTRIYWTLLKRSWKQFLKWASTSSGLGSKPSHNSPSFNKNWSTITAMMSLWKLSKRCWGSCRKFCLNPKE